jgi:hypothetical protein
MTKPLLTAFFLAATTALVSAAPGDKESTEPTERVSYKATGASDDGVVELADPTPANHGRVFITVDEDTRPIARLRLAAHSGRPKILAVQIDTDDGKRRVIRVGKVLGKKAHYVDLRGPQKLVRIMVLSEGTAKAKYTMHGDAPSRVAGR